MRRDRQKNRKLDARWPVARSKYGMEMSQDGRNVESLLSGGWANIAALCSIEVTWNAMSHPRLEGDVLDDMVLEVLAACTKRGG
jgi:hypothetical protein